jgi:ClpP class serine protease
MTFSDFFWLYFLIAILTPMLQRQWMIYQRLRMIHKIEQQRGSRVITLVHRQESLSFLGIPFARYISIDDSEALLRAVRLTPEDMPIDLVLHTPGGLALAAEQIARALLRHGAQVTVMVPHYAMSGGTLIALAANQILMDRNAVLGPLDPQLGNKPAAAILDAVDAKPVDKLEDETLILASVGRKALVQMHTSVTEILVANGMTKDKAVEIADLLTTGRLTHDYAIDFERAQKIGLPVSDSLPQDVYELMDLYPQPSQAQAPAVTYIPLPYERQPRPVTPSTSVSQGGNRPRG